MEPPRRASPSSRDGAHDVHMRRGTPPAAPSSAHTGAGGSLAPHPPAGSPSLAPLDYLNSQRRGSITDPVLHASIPAQQHPSAASGPLASSPRPPSPYVFGDASAHPPSEHGSPHLRRILRPSTGTGEKGTEVGHSAEAPARNPMAMDLDPVEPRISTVNISQARQSIDSGRANPVEPSKFDSSLRRHSIAVGETDHSVKPHRGPTAGPLGGQRPSISSHGVKRKISPDRSAFAPVGEEGTAMNVDSEAPAAKRRGSAYDTQRISQLSVYDRRDSMESLTGRASQLWVNEQRRPSTSSVLSNPSLGSSPGGYASSAFSGDPPHGRPPASMASFAWSSATQQQQSGTEPSPPNASPPGGGVGSSNPNNMSGSGRPSVDHSASPLSQSPAMSQTMTIDRRQSAPEVGPVRTIVHARSRPPSRVGRGSMDSNATADDGYGDKSGGATPYSRSPELRVSHKLAERKRRKEMKELFDELRDQLPADRGMKASKWEILSKAIDFVQNLKTANTELVRENDMLRHENETMRQGIAYAPGASPAHHIIYAPPPAPVVPGAFGQQASGPSAVQQHITPQHSMSRPGSSHNIYAAAAQAPPSQSQSGAHPHSGNPSRNGRSDFPS